MPAPTYLPEAIPTTLGWAHPLTGEQLDCTSGLADPVDYYQPNSGPLSFLDPEGETEFLGFAVVTGRRARIAIHSLHPIVSVEWDFADETDPVIGSYAATHVFPAAEADATFTVVATVTHMIQDPEGEPGELIEADEVVQIEVEIPATDAA